MLQLTYSLSRKVLYTVILTIILVSFSGFPIVHAQVASETSPKISNAAVFRLNDVLTNFSHLVNESKINATRPGPVVTENNTTLYFRWWAVAVTEDQTPIQKADGPTDPEKLFSMATNNIYKDILLTELGSLVSDPLISQIFFSKTFLIFTILGIIWQLVYFQATGKISKDSKYYLKKKYFIHIQGKKCIKDNC